MTKSTAPKCGKFLLLVVPKRMLLGIKHVTLTFMPFVNIKRKAYKTCGEFYKENVVEAVCLWRILLENKRQGFGSVL